MNDKTKNKDKSKKIPPSYMRRMREITIEVDPLSSFPSHPP